MVKRTLIAIAVVALLTTVVHAADPSLKFDDGWPGHWVVDSVDICTIPVYMDVGMYVQVKECNKREIVLKQVDCSAIGKGSGDFPCYKDCDNVQIRANMDVKLGLSKAKIGSVLKDWSAYYDGGDVITGNGSYQTVQVCVTAWKTEIWNNSPGDKVEVGSVTINVKPN